MNIQDRPYAAGDQLLENLPAPWSPSQFGPFSDPDRGLHLLFDVNPQPMLVYDFETLRFLAVNNAAVALYGYTHGEFLSLTIRELWPPDRAAELSPRYAQLTGRELSQPTIWRHRRKDGSLFHAELTAHDLMFGEHRARLMLARDVSVRVQSQRELQLERERAQDSLARLQAVVTSMADGLVVAEPDGTLVAWNPAALAMHEFATEAEVRANINLFPSTFQLRDLTGHLLPLDEWPMSRVLAGHGVGPIELRVSRLKEPGGPVLWEKVLSYSGNPVRDPSGRLVAGMLTIRDVTVQQKMALCRSR